MYPAHVIRAPAGMGKTTAIIKAISKSKVWAELYAPTHALAREMKQNLSAAAPLMPVKVVAGRGHSVGAGATPLCQRHVEADALSKVGVPVYPNLCAVKTSSGITYCPHFHNCAYLIQFRVPRRVMIYTHAHLPLDRNYDNRYVPEVAVIDESFFQSCISITSFHLGAISQASSHVSDPRALITIQSELLAGRPLLRALRSAKLSRVVAVNYRELESKIIAGARSTTASNIQLAQAIAPILPMLEVLGEEIKTARDESYGITLDHSGKVTVHRLRPITRFSGPLLSMSRARQSRILIIDANADQELCSRFFNPLTFESLATKRNAHVVQCHSIRCSTTSIVPSKNKDQSSKAKATARLAVVQTLINSVAAQVNKLLVAGPSAVMGTPVISSIFTPSPVARIAPGRDGSLLYKPGNVAFTHFNGFRGVDRWKDYDAAIVIGRNQPGIKDVEAIARALYAPSNETLIFADDWSLEERGYRMRDGRQIGVEVQVHPDPKIQRIVEQIRESETLQAIDRLRLIHSGTVKPIFIVSNIPLDIEVDELVSFTDLVTPTRFEEALAQTGDVLPLAPDWLSATFPMLWPNRHAAKNDFRDAVKKGRFVNSISINKSTLFNYEYKLARQRRWSRCISHLADPAATEQALQTLLGAAVSVR